MKINQYQTLFGVRHSNQNDSAIYGCFCF